MLLLSAFPFRRWLAVLALLLAGCGGSTDYVPGDAAAAAATAAGQAVFSAVVTDLTGKPIPNAVVTLPVDGKLYRTTTDAKGVYILDKVLLSDFANARPWTLLVWAAGYESQWLRYNGPMVSQVYNAGPLGVELKPLEVNGVSSEALTHIRRVGDDNYLGLINSGFQVALSGSVASVKALDWTTAIDNKGFDRLRLQVALRGLENGRNVVKGFFSLTDVGGTQLASVIPEPDSTSAGDGGFSDYVLDFSLPDGVIPNGPITLAYRTGSRSDGNLDDVEFSVRSLQLRICTTVRCP